MGTLDTRSNDSPVRRSGDSTPVAGNTNKRLEYEKTDKVGFETLPVEIREALSTRKVMLGKEICGDAGYPVTKKRSDGSHYQEITAWWAGTGSYVDIRAVRELRQNSNGSFSPSGSWSAASTVYILPPNLKAVHSVWRSVGSSGYPVKQSTTTTLDEISDNPLDILPPQVVAPVIGGASNAWQYYSKNFANETVVASKLVDDHIRALRAGREGRSHKALPNCDWQVDTIDAPIIDTRLVAIGKPPDSLMQSMERNAKKVPISNGSSNTSTVGHSPSASLN